MGEDQLINLMGIAASLGESTHGRDRRKYQYDRSAFITTQRFAKEFEAVDYILALVGKMVFTCRRYKDNRESINMASWVELCDELAVALSRFRLYIDYRNNAKPYCGVRVRPVCKGVSSQETNPYERCYKLLLEFERGLDSVDFGAVETDYDSLICCVDCRLHAIETGTRDRRRINRKKEGALANFGFGLESEYFAFYDANCPLSLSEEGSKEASDGAGMPDMEEKEQKNEN